MGLISSLSLIRVGCLVTTRFGAFAISGMSHGSGSGGGMVSARPVAGAMGECQQEPAHHGGGRCLGGAAKLRDCRADRVPVAFLGSFVIVIVSARSLLGIFHVFFFSFFGWLFFVYVFDFVCLID